MSQTQSASEITGKHIALSPFVLKICREFKLFPNERTTILSQADDIQILQYCIASYNKKIGNDFEAISKDVLDLLENIKQSTIHNIEQEILTFQCAYDQEKNDKKGSPLNAEENDISKDDQINLVSEDKTLSPDNILTPDFRTSVLNLYSEYKQSSNHCSILDVYVKFIKSVTNKSSELHMVFKACSDIHQLKPDIEDYFTLQTKVIQVLKRINKAEILHHDSKSNACVPHDLSPCNNVQLSPTTPRIQKTNDGNSTLNCGTPKTPCSQPQKTALQKLLVHDIFRSYLHLLVNSRSQLALARVFNIPDRGLDHLAFTHLKHEASDIGLSMYQTLSSYMVRMQLGGSGYAPKSDNPLLVYVKGLGLLLDLTQKLQTVIEEEPKLRAACRRVVNTIKINLIRCSSGKFPRHLVEPVSESIYNSLEEIINEVEERIKKSPEKTTNRGGTILGLHCVRVIHYFLDRSSLSPTDLDLQMMNDIQFSSQTPTRFPCLLTQFRSPAIMDIEEESGQGITDHETELPLGKAKKQKVFVSSALYLDPEHTTDLMVSQTTLNSVYVIPSATIVHPRADPPGPSQPEGETSRSRKCLSKLGQQNPKAITKKKGSKRCHISSTDQENLIRSPATSSELQPNKRASSSLNIESSPKSSRVPPSQNNKGLRNSARSCRRRLLPQVKGQAKITGFFRV